MKALTVRQPWAWAIIHAGKDIENRDWPTYHRGTIAIHAAKGMTRDELICGMAYIETELDKTKLCKLDKTLYRGAIIGLVDLVDCVIGPQESPWFQGTYGFVLRNPRPIEPIPCNGQLGFWTPSPEIQMRLEAARC